MTTIEKIQEVDSILAEYEDWMHGQDGDKCTHARSILNEVTKELTHDKELVQNIEKGESNE